MEHLIQCMLQRGGLVNVLWLLSSTKPVASGFEPTVGVTLDRACVLNSSAEIPEGSLQHFPVFFFLFLSMSLPVSPPTL